MIGSVFHSGLSMGQGGLSVVSGLHWGSVSLQRRIKVMAQRVRKQFWFLEGIQHPHVSLSSVWASVWMETIWIETIGRCGWKRGTVLQIHVLQPWNVHTAGRKI